MPAPDKKKGINIMQLEKSVGFVKYIIQKT